tara:strand:+ start:900 stop:1079 length:180 start_codon:yes stop_codon:yes gene_type:complete
MWKDALKKRKAMTPEELFRAKERLQRERYMKLSPEEKAKYDASLKEKQEELRARLKDKK